MRWWLFGTPPLIGLAYLLNRLVENSYLMDATLFIMLQNVKRIIVSHSSWVSWNKATSRSLYNSIALFIYICYNTLVPNCYSRPKSPVLKTCASDYHMKTPRGLEPRYK